MNYRRFVFFVILAALALVFYYKAGDSVNYRIRGGDRWNTSNLNSDVHAKAVSNGKEPESPMKCTQTARLRHIDAMCQRYEGRTAHPAALDKLSDQEVQKLAVPFVCVDKFKLLGCMNWKCGSSSWNTILWNNSNSQPLFDSFQKITGPKPDDWYVKPLELYTVPEIRFRLNTYFKFTNVRHPLDRLVSVYSERIKINPKYRRFLGKKILSKYYTNISQHDLEEGNGVTFKDLMQFVADGEVDTLKGGHWHSLITRCQPCLIKYDFISRTETMQSDVNFLVNRKMTGRQSNFKARLTRPTQSTKHAHFGRSLPEFKSIPNALFERISDKFRLDMKTYGYSFHRTNGTVVTECKLMGAGQELCC